MIDLPPEFLTDLERRYQDKVQEVVVGDDPLPCPRCETTSLPWVVRMVPGRYPHAAAAFCGQCVDQWGAAFIRWLPKNPEGKRRPTISPGLRWQVIQRGVCVYCRRTTYQLPPGVFMQADHVVPVAKGGETTLDNLVCACSECNGGKTDRTLGENA